jgi:hypothetical protein
MGAVVGGAAGRGATDVEVTGLGGTVLLLLVVLVVGKAVPAGAGDTVTAAMTPRARTVMAAAAAADVARMAG